MQRNDRSEEILQSIIAARNTRIRNVTSQVDSRHLGLSTGINASPTSSQRRLEYVPTISHTVEDHRRSDLHYENHMDLRKGKCDPSELFGHMSHFV